MSIAKAGDAVTDADGNVICYVKRDIHPYMPVLTSGFENFTEGNEEWKPGEVLDPRCFRANPKHCGLKSGLQICINGEWKP